MHHSEEHVGNEPEGEGWVDGRGGGGACLPLWLVLFTEVVGAVEQVWERADQFPAGFFLRPPSVLIEHYVNIN